MKKVAPRLTSRRGFLGAAAVALAGLARSSELRRPPRILLRGSWQSVNIGDIGHTPGALSLLGEYYPEAEITLWPGELGHGARDLLVNNYPRLNIVQGSLDSEGKPKTPELARAWEEADLYLSGSGSGFPASGHAVAFRKATGKPVGVFGVSNDPISGIGGDRDPEGGTLDSIRERAVKLPGTHLSAELRYIIDRAAFFFCRDSITRDYLHRQGVKTPLLEFGTDSQLGMHLRDDAKGLAWLAAQELHKDQFICVVPRLRYTPYYRIRQIPRVPADDIKDAINDRTTEPDHAKLREMIVAYVKNTGHKVLVCAEMTYQIPLGKEVLVDPLPAEIKPHVVWRDTYWLPDEAASIYSQAQCVVSVECHSPLIALANGTPAFYVRQPTDTCKGQMYRDFGAGEWLLEIDETSGTQLGSRVAAIHADLATARSQVQTILAGVERIQRRMVDAVRATIEAGA